jgi:hypothetical protein
MIKIRKKIFFSMIGIILIAAAAVSLIIWDRGLHVYLSEDIQIGEEVRFKSDGLTISGSLIKPETDKPTPAIIAILGAENDTYRYHWDENFMMPVWKPIVETLNNQGYSVLLLDKRGINYSEGHWKRATMNDRVDDVYAAIQYLKGRDDLTDEIGLMGYSQGGWVSQNVAAEHPEDVAFIINFVTPASAVREQIMYEVESDLVCQGLSAEEVKKKWETRKKMYDLYFNLTSHVKLGYLSRIIDHNPTPIIPKIQAPMLAIFAESDQFVNTAVDAPLTEQLLKQGGNDKYRIEMIPGANHWFMEVGRCLPPHAMDMQHEFNPKVLEILSDFKEWYTDIRRG